MKFFYIIIVVFTLWAKNLYAEKPLIAIAGIKGDTPRATQLADLINRHLNNIFRQLSLFDEINQKLLIEQLDKFGCNDEICQTGFATTAGIAVLITGQIETSGKEYFIKIKAFGTDLPYQGKIIVSYQTGLEISGNKNITRLSYLCEEISARFTENFFKNYKRAIFFNKNGNYTKSNESLLNGNYDLFKVTYRDKKDSSFFSKMGQIFIKDDKAVNAKDINLKSSFVLKKYPEKAEFLNKYYYNRKREIVLKSSGCTDAIYAMAATPIISGVMPIAAPVGYYMNRDYTGLSLWFVSSSPYLYSSFRGMYFYRPSRLKKQNKDITRRNKADYYFSYYYTLAGGTALFVDAAAHYALNKASVYSVNEGSGYLGNNYAAVYLSLISGGAGHFYKGDRFWGYFYHHLDNVLLYSALYMYSTKENYNAEDDTYSTGDRNKKKAYQLFGALAFVKLVEIIHLVNTQDDIMLSSSFHQTSTLTPLFYFASRSDYNIGLRYSYRF